MRNALIVVGSERKFWDHAKRLAEYLDTAGIESTEICQAWNRRPHELSLVLLRSAEHVGHSPFLIAYIGHGYKDARTGETGWQYGIEDETEKLRLPYRLLAPVLIGSRKGPTLLLNDCCYAGSLVASGIDLDPHGQIGMIAGAVDEGSCYGHMLADVIAAWNANEVYVPQIRPGTLETTLVIEKRYGPELDRHFFPEPQAIAQVA